MKLIGTVVNNNQPDDGHNIIQTEPHTTLPIGTPLYSAEPHAPLGSPLGGGFFAGEMMVDGELYALVVASKAEGESAEELEYKKNDWRSADDTTSDDDGLLNSDKLADGNHPAADFCRSLQIGGHKDWYLPSRDELAMICRNLGPNRKSTPEMFRAGGAEAFAENWYWSSTEHASYSYRAWGVGFYGGGQYNDYKDFNAGVRAVRRLKI